jgi:hypothetical protein
MLCGNVVLPLFKEGGMGSDPNSCSQDAGKWVRGGLLPGVELGCWVSVSSKSCRLRFWLDLTSLKASINSVVGDVVLPSTLSRREGVCKDQRARRQRQAACMRVSSISTPTTRRAPRDCAVDRFYWVWRRENRMSSPISQVTRPSLHPTSRTRAPWKRSKGRSAIRSSVTKGRLV